MTTTVADLPLATRVRKLEEYIISRYNRHHIECPERGDDFVKVRIPRTFPNISAFDNDIQRQGAILSTDEIPGTYRVTLVDQTDTYADDHHHIAGNPPAYPAVVAASGPSPGMVVVYTLILVLLVGIFALLLRSQWMLLNDFDTAPPPPRGDL